MSDSNGSRRGRPRKINPRNRSITIRLTEEEYEHVKSLCDDMISTPSEVIRSIIDTYLFEEF